MLTIRPFLILLLSLLIGFTSACAGPGTHKSSSASMLSSHATINHSSWNGLLKKYVVKRKSGVNLFKYGSLKKSAKDMAKLDGYLAKMASLDPRIYNHNEQKAYWLNVYNAITVKAITSGYPMKKFTDMSSKKITVMQKPLSLNDIKYSILLPTWKEHKLLFGLNCASYNCPGLQPEAYTGARLKSLLSLAGTNFISHQKGVVYYKGKLRASVLFRNDLKHFAKSEKTLSKVLAHYAKGKLALYLLGSAKDITYIDNPKLNSI